MSRGTERKSKYAFEGAPSDHAIVFNVIVPVSEPVLRHL